MEGLLKVPPMIRAPSGINNETYNDKYVITYNFGEIDSDTASHELEMLLTDLEAAGLQTEVRAGYDQILLIFVKAPRELLGNTVYKSRVKDWLYGIVPDHPGGHKNTVVDGKYEAEDILSTYHLVNWSKEQGGAGITPGHGKWERVTSIFPLHNERLNQSLLTHLSKHIFLTHDDLDQIRDLWGSKVAFYFAFIQTYLVFLIFPAVTGVAAWLFLPKYSLFYAILTCVWCTVFLEYWKIQEVDLSIRWNVRGIAHVKVNRPQFKWESVTTDEAGREHHHFSRKKQVLRQLLQIPFILFATLALGTMIVSVFAIEVLISESYEGPYKSYLEYLPTVLLAVALPYITTYLEEAAENLTEFENHRTADHHEMSLTQKVFVLNIVTNYLPILLTAFVYVPFGDDVIPYLEKIIGKVLGSVGKEFEHQPFSTDSDRLRNEVIALVVTGQLSGFFEENILPFVKHKFSGWWREIRRMRSKDSMLMSVVRDDIDEAEFLKRVRNQATLPKYDVQEDISEIVLQFGYLALFSPVWPLIPMGFLINNWIELRSDFLKICIEHQRPAPVRTDGIGPWIYSLDLLTWLGSISTAAIVHLFGSSTLGIGTGAWYTLPFTIFVSEHIFLVFRSLVCFVLEKLGSEQIRKERNQRYATRVKRLEELEANKQQGLGLSVAERERRKSVRATGSDLLFTKQVEDGKSAAVAVGLINRVKQMEASKQLEGQEPKLD
ncbi:calcium-activated chloride channel-domain-containing protein [Plectosphaerella plurivora]|uniref:Calcium-activated chloride channel-domain-containing protein n=1 Tax=Plectosphaerella plurivora TaxID=936078 RepID=A0A9P8VJR2_9PEZI|nr:calcium-activated chloride channel-domain-containing protein [Plectosphaerella plurivora]